MTWFIILYLSAFIHSLECLPTNTMDPCPLCPGDDALVEDAKSEELIKQLRQAKEKAERDTWENNALARIIEDLYRGNNQAQLMSKMDLFYDNHTDLDKELKFIPNNNNCGSGFDITILLEKVKAHRGEVTQPPQCIEDFDDACDSKPSNGPANQNGQQCSSSSGPPSKAIGGDKGNSKSGPKKKPETESKKVSGVNTEDLKLDLSKAVTGTNSQGMNKMYPTPGVMLHPQSQPAVPRSQPNIAAAQHAEKNNVRMKKPQAISNMAKQVAGPNAVHVTSIESAARANLGIQEQPGKVDYQGIPLWKNIPGTPDRFKNEPNDLVNK